MLSRSLSRLARKAPAAFLAPSSPVLVCRRSKVTMSEDTIKRNPHPDFKKVEASRPAWDASSSVHYTQTANPAWTFGSGGNETKEGSEAGSSSKKHVAIDPYEDGRPSVFNYKLLISSIAPRPIAFLSTRSPDGSSTNLAPFSYFNVLNHDPPLFVVGFSADATKGSKDSLRNIRESGECVINIISEHYVEAANSTAINAPYGASEWDVSGLTPSYDCETVGCARVAEAVFSIEAKLDTLKEYDSRATPGKHTGTVAILEGTRFWAREDALNDDKNMVDLNVLRPVGRLGGITYSRTKDAFEIPRPDFQKDLGGQENLDKLKKDT